MSLAWRPWAPLAMAYQGKRRLVEELKAAKPPGKLESWPPYINMVAKAERPKHWQLVVSPAP